MSNTYKLTPEQESARYKCYYCGKKKATYDEVVCPSCKAIFSKWQGKVTRFSQAHDVPIYILKSMMENVVP
jgi:hypothetical protein